MDGINGCEMRLGRVTVAPWSSAKLQFLILFFGVAVASMLVPRLAYAQMQGVPKICLKDSGAFIAKCAATCFEACDKNVKFFQKYKKKCIKLYTLPEAERKDSASVCRAATRAAYKKSKYTYAQCRERVRKYFEAYSPPPAPDGPLNEAYTKRPKCATPIKKLVANLICLRNEYRVILNGLDELNGLGISDVSSASDLCKLSKAQFQYSRKLAVQLRNKADRLQKDFSALDECRKSLITWSDGLSGVCRVGGAVIPTCEKLVKQLAEQRQPYLQRISEISQALGTRLSSLNDEISVIEQLYSMTVDCGPRKPIEDIGEIDDLLGEPEATTGR